MSNNTATQIAFTATAPQPIAWGLHLEYQTSGGRGPFKNERSFTTTSDQQRTEQYTGMGGQLTVTVSSEGCPDQQINLLITGAVIPDDEITARLVQLYNDGATPRLMTGIAAEESTYRQFANRRLYNVNALWPLESYDGGSHIGLMMVPVSMTDAWDWLANTADGVGLFVNEKFPAARRLTARIIASHPGLRQLSPVELEHMAMVLYGPHGSRNLERQYYAPIRATSGGWDWVVNTAENPGGVAYTNYVFNHLR